MSSVFFFCLNSVFGVTIYVMKGVGIMKIITDSLVENFTLYLRNEERSSATLDKYIRDIKSFKIWCGDRKIEKELMLEYKQYLIERYAPASVNSAISSLNSFFEFNECYDLKLRTLKIQKQIFSRPQQELSKEEYMRLLQTAKSRNNKRLYLVMQTICSAGIRVSELKFITVAAVRERQVTINCKGKMRVVMLPKQLCKMLLDYTKEEKILSGSVFVTRNKKPIDRSNIWRDMKELCESAGVDKNKVFPHNLRHLFARTYYSLQKDIVRLADILGHSSVNTTRIYTMESGEEHRKHIQKLGLLLC